LIGRRTLTELFFVVLGLGVALWLTIQCADAYPLGRVVIWRCGGAAMLATLAMAVPTIRRALADDARTAGERA